MIKMLLVFLLFYSCAITPPVPPPAPAPTPDESSVFMPTEDIFKDLNENKSNKAATKMMRTKADNDRLMKLVPLKIFFPEGEKKSHKAFPVAELKLKVDLRSNDTPIKDQDDGKCTAFAGVAALETNIGNKIVLSSWDAWGKYRVYACESFVDALVLKDNRICEEMDYPQYGSRSSRCNLNRSTYLSDVRDLGSDLNGIVSTLNAGRVVYVGMSTPNDIVACKKVVNPKNGFANGGHAMVVVGYLTDPSLPNEVVGIIRNSWGSDCGDKGYHYMPLSIIKKAGAYFNAWDFKSVVSDTTPLPPSKPQVPTPEKECVKWARVWFAPWKYKCTIWE